MRITLIALALAAFSAACGNSIGDSCNQNSDCSQEGERICDTASPGGYCTVEHCDFGTCPGESECVRFYPVSQLTKDCPNGDVDCSLDETCVFGAEKCAPRSTERRFCMKKCDNAGDCRDEYECRTPDRMAIHGGEPVPDPESGEAPMSGGDLQPFCAPALTCLYDTDCDSGDRCDVLKGRCAPAL